MGSNEDRGGRLDLTVERRKARGSKRCMPWFEVPGRASRKLSILFGHRAALDRKGTKHRNVHPLDTGCANGGRFTALRLQDGRYFRVRCKNESVPWSSAPGSTRKADSEG